MIPTAYSSTVKLLLIRAKRWLKADECFPNNARILINQMLGLTRQRNGKLCEHIKTPPLYTDGWRKQQPSAGNGGRRAWRKDNLQSAITRSTTATTRKSMPVNAIFCYLRRSSRSPSLTLRFKWCDDKHID